MTEELATKLDQITASLENVMARLKDIETQQADLLRLALRLSSYHTEAAA